MYTSTTTSEGYYVLGAICYDHSYLSEADDSMSAGYAVRAVRPVSTVTMTDNDGNNYSTVKIGLQRWITSNLKVEEYRNTTPIAYIAGNSEWIADDFGAMCYWDNEQESGIEGEMAVFYRGTQDPTGTDRLNYNGDFYASRLFANGIEVGGGTTLWEIVNDVLQPIDNTINGVHVWGEFTLESYVLKTISFSWLDLMITPGNPPSGGNIGMVLMACYEIGNTSLINFVMPNDWIPGTSLSVEITWAIDEAYSLNNGEVNWEIFYQGVQRNTTEQVDDVSNWTTAIGDVAIPSTAKTIMVSKYTISTSSNEIEYDDLVTIGIQRVALNNGNDPDVALPGILALNIVYQSDKIGATMPN